MQWQIPKGLILISIRPGFSRVAFFDSVGFPSIVLSVNHPQKSSWKTTMLLAYQSLGVVYGDLSISPLYVYKSTFADDITHSETNEEIFGVLSFVFWTLTLVPLLKYVFIVLRAHDNGQGDLSSSKQRRLDHFIFEFWSVFLVLIQVVLLPFILWYVEMLMWVFFRTSKPQMKRCRPTNVNPTKLTVVIGGSKSGLRNTRICILFFW